MGKGGREMMKNKDLREARAEAIMERIGCAGDPPEGTVYREELFTDTKSRIIVRKTPVLFKGEPVSAPGVGVFPPVRYRFEFTLTKPIMMDGKVITREKAAHLEFDSFRDLAQAFVQFDVKISAYVKELDAIKVHIPPSAQAEMPPEEFLR